MVKLALVFMDVAWQLDLMRGGKDGEDQQVVELMAALSEPTYTEPA